MKRFVSFLLALCMAASFMAPAALAEVVSLPVPDAAATAPEVSFMEPLDEQEPAQSEQTQQEGQTVLELSPPEAVSGAVSATDTAESGSGVALEGADESAEQQETNAPATELEVSVTRGDTGGVALESAPVSADAVQAVTQTVDLQGVIDRAKAAATYNSTTTDSFTSFGNQLSGYDLVVNGTRYDAGKQIKEAYDALTADFAKGESSRIFQQNKSDPVVATAFYIPAGMSNDQLAAMTYAMAVMVGFAFDWDTPEMFYSNSAIGWDAGIYEDANGKAVVLSLLPSTENEFANLSTRQSVQQLVRQRIDTLVSATANMSQEQTLRYFHDWLCQNNTYNYDAASAMGDFSSSFPWSAASALLGNSGTYNQGPVCEGYARALQWLCKERGMRCILVVSSNHMWNNVVVNGRWTGVDVTFDDGQGPNGYNHGYFMKNDLNNGDPQHMIDHLYISEDRRGYVDFAYPVLGGEDLISQFVVRLYETCMGRTPGAEEVNAWADVLVSGREGGAQVAYNFVFSKEFKNKNLCNEDYIKQLYTAFMDRTPSASEVAAWVGELESGKTREEAFNGFAMSKESTNICVRYGINLGNAIEVPQYGTIPAGACSVCGKEAPVVEFVARLYRTCLNREPEAEGQAKWVNQLVTHANSGRDAAYGFVFSKEFINKNYSNTDYVKQLYRAFMGREFDQAGLDSWVKLLNEGTSREEVFDGFVGSKEFSNICARYGIVRG